MSTATDFFFFHSIMNAKKMLALGLVGSFALGASAPSASAFFGREFGGESEHRGGYSQSGEQGEFQNFRGGKRGGGFFGSQNAESGEEQERGKKRGGKKGPRFSEEQIEALKAAREEGGVDAVKELLEEYKAEKEAEREERQANREAVKAAIEANDYDAFVEAVADTPMAEQVDTEAKFELLVEMHELKTRIDEIREELGLPEKGHGEHRGPQEEEEELNV